MNYNIKLFRLTSRELLASRIVHHAFGIGSSVKRGNNNSKVARCLAIASKPTAVSNFYKLIFEHNSNKCKSKN